MPPASLGTQPHQQVLEKVIDLKSTQAVQKRPPKPRRRKSRQKGRRRLEQTVKEKVVDFYDWVQELGLNQLETAARLHLLPRTLRQWLQDDRIGAGTIQLRGRPLARSDRAHCNQVMALLNQEGPRLGLPRLQSDFPDMARAELEDLLHCYRAVWRHSHPRLLRVLHWLKPQTVWAMDFAEAPCRIDGLYRYLLAIRDLASGQQLLWLPVQDPTARTVLEALGGLFMIYGAPAVMKSDNGSAFIADRTQEFLGQFGVVPLYSPPHWPAYNGACEASIRWLKVWTEQHAARHGHPGMWTWEDVQAARRHANEGARSGGSQGPVPQAIWRNRKPITLEERLAFMKTIAEQENEVYQSRTLVLGNSLSATEEASIRREAIQRALMAHGFLCFSRRRIYLKV